MHPLDRRGRIAHLLDELCAQFGFCLPAEARGRVDLEPPANPDAFAAAVYRIEGFDPTSGDPALHGRVRAVIAQTLSASGYRDA